MWAGSQDRGLSRGDEGLGATGREEVWTAWGGGVDSGPICTFRRQESQGLKWNFHTKVVLNLEMHQGHRKNSKPLFPGDESGVHSKPQESAFLTRTLGHALETLHC